MKIYSYPKDYKRCSSEYEISANGNKIGVYECDVSKYAWNHIWYGSQRPFSQTELAHYVTFGCDSEVTLDITPKKAYDKVTVRPTAKNAKVDREGQTISVKFPGPGQYVIEFDDRHHTLAVFINPEKDFSYLKDEKNVLYFAPGVHYVNERIMLCDGQTVFIDEGAVVYGSINAVGKKDISLIGYGIIDGSMMKRQDAIQTTPEVFDLEDKSIGLTVYFDKCENVHIEGVTVIDSSEWCVKSAGCKNEVIDNIKIIGQWRYNTDGCDMVNCQNVILRNSFIRAFDDCITVKGLRTNRESPVDNIYVENCVTWCDWGRCLEVGAETCAPYMRNITFKNCYLIRGHLVMLDVQQSDAANVENVLFKDIEVEYCGDEQIPFFPKTDEDEYPYQDGGHVPTFFALVSGTNIWSFDKFAGNMNNIRIENINVTAPKDTLITILVDPREEQSKIENVYVKNVVVNGKHCKLKDLDVVIRGNGTVRNVTDAE